MQNNAQPFYYNMSLLLKKQRSVKTPCTRSNAAASTGAINAMRRVPEFRGGAGIRRILLLNCGTVSHSFSGLTTVTFLDELQKLKYITVSLLYKNAIGASDFGFEQWEHWEGETKVGHVVFVSVRFHQ
jgi:hypothetical protein